MLEPFVFKFCMFTIVNTTNQSSSDPPDPGNRPPTKSSNFLRKLQKQIYSTRGSGFKSCLVPFCVEFAWKWQLKQEKQYCSSAGILCKTLLWLNLPQF